MKSVPVPGVGPAATSDPLPWCSASPKDTAVVLFQWVKKNVPDERGVPAVVGLSGFAPNQDPINPGLCQWAPPTTEPARCTYIHPLYQTKKWKNTRRKSNVIQYHLTNAYTKSADEQYLYSSDDTAQEKTVSSTNKLFSQQLS